MSTFTVHGIAGSPFLRSVQLALEEKQADYSFQPIAPLETRSASNLERHPFGRTPSFEHGEFRLYETQAILRYLDTVIAEPALTPRDPRRTARMNQIMGINDWYLFPKVAAVIVFQRIVGPALLGVTTDEAACVAALPMARTCIGELERLLGEQAFLAGDELSLADLLLAPQLDFLAATAEGRTLLAGTRLERWLARMNLRPSMRATQRPERLRSAA
jgi:glutathione S-transferase